MAVNISGRENSCSIGYVGVLIVADILLAGAVPVLVNSEQLKNNLVNILNAIGIKVNSAQLSAASSVPGATIVAIKTSPLGAVQDSATTIAANIKANKIRRSYLTNHLAREANCIFQAKAKPIKIEHINDPAHNKIKLFNDPADNKIKLS